jgi:hypothetical protein
MGPAQCSISARNGDVITAESIEARYFPLSATAVSNRPCRRTHAVRLLDQAQPLFHAHRVFRLRQVAALFPAGDVGGGNAKHLAQPLAAQPLSYPPTVHLPAKLLRLRGPLHRAQLKLCAA